MAKSFSGLGATVCDATADLPSSPSEGMLVFQKDTNELKIYDGAAWVSMLDTDAPPGLQIIKPTSVSGTGVTSSNGAITASATPVIGVNGVFSATYANYRIMIDIESSRVTADDALLRLAVGGTENATSGNYYFAGAGFESGGSSNNFASGTTRTAFFLAASGTGLGRLGIAIDMFNPFAAQRTSIQTTFSYFNTATTFYNTNISGGMTVTTSYDGFTYTPGVGTLSGTIRVYGYQNS